MKLRIGALLLSLTTALACGSGSGSVGGAPDGADSGTDLPDGGGPDAPDGSDPETGPTGPWTCESPGTLVGGAYCSACTFASNASPAACTKARPINACCTWVGVATAGLARATGLHEFASDDPTLDLGCLTTPKAQGSSKTVTLNGHVKLFSSGADSANVKVEIFREGADGSLGAAVGAAAITTSAESNTATVTWLTKCPSGGCKLRPFTIAGVPTETPLIVKTSDAGGGLWADRYEYGVYISNGSVDAQGNASRDALTIAAIDLNTVASAAGGFTLRADRGLILGEVHDCGDVRLSGAAVDTDLAHEGDVVFFGDSEADPLPDKTRRADVGTSKLGVFGVLNVATGTPVRVRAVGTAGGGTLLVGSYTVRIFAGAVTALSIAGRGPSK